MEYSNNYPYFLESISIFGQGFSFASLIPRWLLLNLDPNLFLDENEEGKEVTDSFFSEFITFANDDPTFPNLPTQIVRHLPKKTITASINYVSVYNGGNYYVSQIVVTGFGQTNDTYIYYNNKFTQITKMCLISCTYFSYDSFGRLLSISENGIVLASYQYSGIDISSVKSIFDGSWSFF